MDWFCFQILFLIAQKSKRSGYKAVYVEKNGLVPELRRIKDLKLPYKNGDEIMFSMCLKNQLSLLVGINLANLRQTKPVSKATVTQSLNWFSQQEVTWLEGAHPLPLPPYPRSSRSPRDFLCGCATPITRSSPKYVICQTHFQTSLNPHPVFYSNRCHITFCLKMKYASYEMHRAY